jgi:hypothetical protein
MCLATSTNLKNVTTFDSFFIVARADIGLFSREAVLNELSPLLASVVYVALINMVGS